MTKLSVAFRNFMNAAENENNIQFVVCNRISVIKFQILKFHYKDELVNVELRIIFLYVIRYPLWIPKFPTLFDRANK
jgi:hypothetical protein